LAVASAKLQRLGSALAQTLRCQHGEFRYGIPQPTIGPRMHPSPLEPLPGAALDGAWRISDADRADADGRLAIFAIVARPSADRVCLLGTGFYLLTNGGFATAAHVAAEAQKYMTDQPNSVCITHTVKDGPTVFRPIWRFFTHNQADIAFGVPHEILLDGVPDRNKILSLDVVSPVLGSNISTWSYPLHQVLSDETNKQIIQLQPGFYNGTLQQYFLGSGPSAKLVPPYFLTNIHLYGGSSGGPVFGPDGHVFGIASCSYDGAEDIAYVTPIKPIYEIELKDTNHGANGVSTPVKIVRELVELGFIGLRDSSID